MQLISIEKTHFPNMFPAFFFFIFVPCILVLSKFNLFTNWCTTELS